jgi:HTH-type transcriptional regulator, competence development regulator
MARRNTVLTAPRKPAREENMSFGRYIRREREARALTLIDLAAQLDISPPYLSRIERDRENIPPDHLLTALSGALGIPEDTLFAMARRLPPDLRSRAGDVIALYRQSGR